MRILVIGDHESKSLWDFYEPSKLEDIDLIISCGDLSPRYLSFLGMLHIAMRCSPYVRATILYPCCLWDMYLVWCTIFYTVFPLEVSRHL